jgi:preprotein translocase subunit SecA
MIRDDEDDEVYRTAAEKYRAIIALIEDCKERGQPVLVGTTSIEKSELLAEMLVKEGWEQHDFSDVNAFKPLYAGDEKAKKTKVFAVLNARYHEQEAFIIAQAGVPGAVTIATNMAGRGTDIQLGGNPDMRIARNWATWKRGRAHARGRENPRRSRAPEGKGARGRRPVRPRHRAPREPAHRQPAARPLRPPGRSRHVEILPVAGRRSHAHLRLRPLGGMLTKLGLKENEAIVHPWINKALEKAQQKVEARNFDIRKNLLKYDDVMNDQRKVIFEQRIDLMREEDVAETVGDMRHAVIADMVNRHIPENAYPEQWDAPAADARPSVARAPADARTSAPGGRPARLRPARSAQRVQVGSLHSCSRRCCSACARWSRASSCASRSALV